MYYCSKRLAGCKVSVKLDKHGNVEKVKGEHSHEPPRYTKMATGEYIKLEYNEFKISYGNEIVPSTTFHK